MGIDPRGSDIVVPEQVLNRADIRTALPQVGGKRMTKGVGADGLGQTGPAHRHLDRLVDDAGVNMMATGEASTWIYGKIPRGKDTLPAPCAQTGQQWERKSRSYKGSSLSGHIWKATIRPEGVNLARLRRST